MVTLTLGSCFDPPEFSVVPQIEYESIEFKEKSTPSGSDSLIVTLSFKDGDGDLGLDAAAPEFNSTPYNNLTFHQTSSADPANLIEINTTLVNIDYFTKLDQRVNEPFQLLLIDDVTKGNLVFPRTRKQPGFGYLPAYDNSCQYYERLVGGNFAIDAKQSAILGPGALVDTLFRRENNNRIPLAYVLRDTLYLKVNKNHYNIEVDFFVKEPSNPKADQDGFVEFDWREQYCQSYDGRFPILTDTEGPLEGSIRYSIGSIGLKNIFTIKTMKLRIMVRDRALNESNVIFTKEFTLDSI